MQPPKRTSYRPAIDDTIVNQSDLIWFLALAISLKPNKFKKIFSFFNWEIGNAVGDATLVAEKAKKKSEIIFFLTGKLGNAVDDVTLMAQKAKKFKRLLQIRRKLGNVGNAVDDVT